MSKDIFLTILYILAIISIILIPVSLLLCIWGNLTVGLKLFLTALILIVVFGGIINEIDSI